MCFYRPYNPSITHITRADVTSHHTPALANAGAGIAPPPRPPPRPRGEGKPITCPSADARRSVAAQTYTEIDRDRQNKLFKKK